MVLRPNIHDILHCLWSVDLGSVRKVCRRWGEGAAEGFTNFSKKKIHIPADYRPKWPSNFFRKYFIAPPINFGFLFKTYL